MAWTLHFLTEGRQFSLRKPAIRRAVAEAEPRVAAVTAPLALDIVVRAVRGLRETMVVDGHCYRPGVIGLRIDFDKPNAKALLHEELLKTLFHEFHHALRWEGPGYGETLGEALVSEGLAQRFLHEIIDCPPAAVAGMTAHMATGF